MNTKWAYAIFVMVLFAVIVLGVPWFPDAMAVSVSGWFNVGMLLYLLLNILAPLLAFIYLRQRSGSDS